MVSLRRALVMFAFIMLHTLTARGGEDEYYRVFTLPTPEGVPFEVSGLCTLTDGRLAACIRKGEVWVIENAGDDPPANIRYQRIAEALHEPLGLIQHGDSLYTTQRSEVTRLRDVDGDDVIDEYLTFARGWGVSGNSHEYAYGPIIDGKGDFYVTLNITIGPEIIRSDAWRGWGMKLNRDGGVTPIAAGMRSPCGLGRNVAGDVFFTDQQGNWVPTNTLHQLKRGAFYGHVDSLKSCALKGSPIARPANIPAGKPIGEAHRELPMLRLPAVWFPYRKMGMSATDIACDETGGRFGPFDGQLFVGDFTEALISRVFLEKVNGEYQGACFPFLKGFQCAVLRLCWGKDGSLFVGETNRGWNSTGSRSFGLQRVVWNQRIPFEVKEMRARANGFDLVFTQPVDPDTAADPASYSMSNYTYLYHADYGSPEIDSNQLAIQSAHVMDDGKTVRLTIAGLRPTFVHELRADGVRSANGNPLLHALACYTLNHIPDEDP